MSTFRDAMGREVTITEPPQRIVSLVPSITETLFAFGAGQRVVGVTRFCIEPREGVRGKVKVGGTKDVNAETVASLQPDLVIANAEENTREDVESLIAAGMPVFVTFARTVADAVAEMLELAAVLGPSDEATEVILACEAALAETAQDTRTRVRVFCPIWRGPWMTIGRDTYIHDVIRLSGGENVFAGAPERYPETTLEQAASLAPEVVLLPDEPYHFRKRHIPEVIEKMPDARIYLVDGKDLCWYGPRVPAGLRNIRRILREETGV